MTYQRGPIGSRHLFNLLTIPYIPHHSIRIIDDVNINMPYNAYITCAKTIFSVLNSSKINPTGMDAL